MSMLKRCNAVFISLGIAMILLVSGCGAKGKLYLPEEQQQSKPEASTSMEPAATEETSPQAELKKDKAYKHPDY